MEDKSPSLPFSAVKGGSSRLDGNPETPRMGVSLPSGVPSLRCLRPSVPFPKCQSALSPKCQRVLSAWEANRAGVGSAFNPPPPRAERESRVGGDHRPPPNRPPALPILGGGAFIFIGPPSCPPLGFSPLFNCATKRQGPAPPAKCQKCRTGPLVRGEILGQSYTP